MKEKLPQPGTACDSVRLRQARGFGPSSFFVPEAVYTRLCVPYNLAAMKTALRVLTAITNRETPEDADLQELHRYAPEFVHLPPDRIGLRRNPASAESAGRSR
jgi:hypothetical protein